MSTDDALPLTQVISAGGELKAHLRFVGRWQRKVFWLVNGNLIAPDWQGVRSWHAAELMPKRAD